MDVLSHYLAMGGYGAFVWGSYGVAILILTALAGISWRRLRKVERLLNDSSKDRHGKARP